MATKKTTNNVRLLQRLVDNHYYYLYNVHIGGDSMTFEVIMTELEALGSDQIKQIYYRHGIKDPVFGVKVGDLKPFQKKIKKDYELSKALYDTGNHDAIYLAGLIADEAKMTKEDFEIWIKAVNYTGTATTTIASVAAESRFGFELAREWIDSDDYYKRIAAWSIWTYLLAIKPSETIDISEVEALLNRCKDELQSEEDHIRYGMNNFIISVGGYVPELTNYAKIVADHIGTVTVDMGDTACKVPDARAYIEKMEARGNIGKKRKKARC